MHPDAAEIPKRHRSTRVHSCYLKWRSTRNERDRRLSKLVCVNLLYVIKNEIDTKYKKIGLNKSGNDKNIQMVTKI